MKSLTLLAIYIASFILIFLMISFVGYVFTGSYIYVIRNGTWQFMYSVFLGWYLAIIPTREYYLHNKEIFDKIFN